MIREVNISDRPVCPGCNQRDKVQAIRGINADSKSDDLASWWCNRCNGRLSTLPVRYAESADPVERQRSEDRVNAILGRRARDE
jgi:hypothetical protein